MVAGSEQSDERRRRLGPGRSEAFAFLELWAVAGIAVAQPVLDLLSRNAGLLLANDASALEVVLLCLAVLLVPALAAYGAELFVALVSPRARPWVHAGLIGAFAGLFLVQLLSVKGVVVALGVGAVTLAGVVWLVTRFRSTRTYLRVLAVAPVLFAVLFLVASPASTFVFPSGSQGVSGAAIGNPKRVVMIVLDELPLGSLLDGEGHIDAEQFPGFARLAAGSTWYRNDTTVHGFTEWAVPALLTGQLPTDPAALPVAEDHPDSIFRLLGGAYRMNVHESVTRLCPSSVCVARQASRGVVGSVAHLLRATTDLWTSSLGGEPEPSTPLVLVGAGDRRAPMEDFVSSLRASTTPTFDFVHLLLPHQPWQYLPSGQDAGRVEGDQALRRANIYAWGSEWAARIGEQREVLQLQAADRFVGRVVDRLRAIGAWDDSMVVVTADHGAAFTVGEPIRWIKDANAAEILWTPLFVHTPGQTTGRVDDRPVESVDVVPTIADVLGIDIPWKVDGVSALGRPRVGHRARFAQWDLTAPKPPPDVPFAPEGGTLRLATSERFASVLATRAVPPGSDPALRPYAIGPYGTLIGRPVSDLVAGGPVGSASIGDPARFAAVDPAASAAPWTWIEGRVQGLTGDRPLAVAVNGRIAGLTSTDAAGSGIPGYYLVMLAPSLFATGANEVAVFEITGPANAPRLRPLTVTAGAPAR